MRVTIIPDEKRVNVEGVMLMNIDCSSVLAFDPDIHVVQWYGEHGEIEYWHPPGKMIGLRPNLTITDFSPFQAALDAWEEEAKKDVA